MCGLQEHFSSPHNNYAIIIVYGVKYETKTVRQTKTDQSSTFSLLSRILSIFMDLRMYNFPTPKMFVGPSCSFNSPRRILSGKL